MAREGRAIREKELSISPILAFHIRKKIRNTATLIFAKNNKILFRFISIFSF